MSVRRLVFLVIFLPLIASLEVHASDGADAGDDDFDISFLANGAKVGVDISQFRKTGGAQPGTYTLDVYINQMKMMRQKVIIQKNDKGNLVGCLDAKIIPLLNINYVQLPPAAGETLREKMKSGSCLILEDVIPGAKSSIDLSELRFEASMPQIYSSSRPQGYVDSKFWDKGLQYAGFVNYSINEYRSTTVGGTSTAQRFFGLNGGLNVAGWQYRHAGSYSQQLDKSDGSAYISSSNYIQRNLRDWKAKLSIGADYTSSEVLTGVPYTGFQIASDIRMQPDSLQGYAPTIRGVAETSARVSIVQNGITLYETNVTPGEFLINDLYTPPQTGDLIVTVTEADGRVSQSRLPYFNVPQLLREDASRYSLAAGKWRDAGVSNLPLFLQGSYQYGLNAFVTLYGGGFAMNGYTNIIAGTGFNTSFGAVSTDISESTASDFGVNSSSTLAGRSYQLRYISQIESSKTVLNFLASHTDLDYLSNTDYVSAINNNVYTFSKVMQKKQMSVSQSLEKGWGSVYFTGSTQNYWGQSGETTSWQLGYSNSVGQLNFGVTSGMSYDLTGKVSRQVSVNLSIPLGKAVNGSNLSSSFVQSDDSISRQMAMSGVLSEERRINYSVFASESRSGSNSTTASGMGLQSTTSLGSFAVNLSNSQESTQLGWNATGALVYHPGGVIMAQTVGESFAIIEAPSAKGAVVNGQNTVRINDSGFAVLSSLMPYRSNEVTLNPQGISSEVELLETVQTATVEAGAIAYLKYPTLVGKPFLISLSLEDGSVPPVGAYVGLAGKEHATLVGQRGFTFLRALENQELLVTWGRAKNERCKFTYSSPKDVSSLKKIGEYYSIREKCIFY